MFTKVLISVLVCSNIRLILAAPNSLASSKDDAEQAFHELAALNGQLLQAAISNMTYTVFAILKTMTIDKAVNNIYSETQHTIDEMKSTISNDLQTLEDFGLDSSVCKGDVFNQLDEFLGKITNRANSCGAIAGKILDNWLNKTSEEMSNLGDSILSCNYRNLMQCYNYTVDDSCYDAVIDGIEQAKSIVSLNYQIVITTFFTKIADYKLPCQDLLNYEAAHYLRSRLQTVRNCITIQLKLAQRSSCYLS